MLPRRLDLIFMLWNFESIQQKKKGKKILKPHFLHQCLCERGRLTDSRKLGFKTIVSNSEWRKIQSQSWQTFEERRRFNHLFRKACICNFCNKKCHWTKNWQFLVVNMVRMLIKVNHTLIQIEIGPDKELSVQWFYMIPLNSTRLPNFCHQTRRKLVLK